MGWTPLNSGAYSDVYKNPRKNYVMKVTTEPDYGYAKYVDLIKRSRNPHFPKISDRKTFTVRGDDYDIYLIEKLRHLEWDIATQYVNIFRNIIWTRVANLRVDLNDLYNNNIPKILSQNPKLVSALEIIGENSSDQELDIKNDNIMERDDGTIVITDPYAS